MVERRVTDGVRIAQLLSSEVDGREDGALDRLAVTNADTDVEGTADGERAFDVTLDGDALGAVFVHDEYARLELQRGGETAKSRAEEAGLRAEEGDDGDGEAARLFVESGAEVKRAVDALDAVSGALRE